jgi:hypothetical protein
MTEWNSYPNFQDVYSSQDQLNKLIKVKEGQGNEKDHLECIQMFCFMIRVIINKIRRDMTNYENMLNNFLFFLLIIRCFQKVGNYITLAELIFIKHLQYELPFFFEIEKILLEKNILKSLQLFKNVVEIRNVRITKSALNHYCKFALENDVKDFFIFEVIERDDSGNLIENLLFLITYFQKLLNCCSLQDCERERLKNFLRAHHTYEEVENVKEKQNTNPEKHHPTAAHVAVSVFFALISLSCIGLFSYFKLSAATIPETIYIGLMSGFLICVVLCFYLLTKQCCIDRKFIQR